MVSWLRGKRIVFKIIVIIAIILSLLYAGVWGYQRYIPSTLIARAQKMVFTFEQTLKTFFNDHKNSIQHFLDTHADQFSILLQSSEKSSAVSAEIREHLAAWNGLGFSDFLFISPDNRVLFSYTKQIPEGINIQEQYKDSNFFSAVEDAEILLAPVISSYDEFKINAQTPAFATMFLAVPLIAQQKFMGTFVVQLNTRNLTQIFSQAAQDGFSVTVGKYDVQALILFSSDDSTIALKERLSLKMHRPLPLALEGQEGADILQTPDERLLINARTFLIDVGFGLVIYKDVTLMFTLVSIIKSILIILGILLLVLLMMYAYEHADLLRDALRKRWREVAIYGCVLSIIIGLLLCGFFMITYRRVLSETLYRMRQNAQSDFSHSSSMLAQDLNKQHFITAATALDVGLGKIKDAQQWDSYISKTFEKYPFVSAVVVSYVSQESERMVPEGLFIYRNGILDKHPLPRTYSNSDWYRSAAKGNSIWSKAFFNNELNSPVVAYAQPFYQGQSGQPVGVIAFVYSYSNIKDIVTSIGIEKEKNSYVITKDGLLMYHQKPHYVTDQLQLNLLTNELESGVFLAYEKGLKGYSGAFYFKALKNEPMWAFYDAVPTTEWVLVTLFKDTEFKLFSLSLYHISLAILFGTLFILSGCMGLWLLFGGLSIRNLKIVSTLCSIILILSIIIILYLATLYIADSFDRSILKGRGDVEKYLEEGNHKNVIPVMTGILVNYIDMGDYILVNANMWQKATGKDVHEDGIQIKNIVKKTSMVKTEAKSGKGWDVIAHLYGSEQDSSLYPFDSQLVEIVMKSANVNKKHFLIPDFESYRTLKPQALPGINPSIYLGAFNMTESFFSYKENATYVDKDPINNDLVFNLVLKRNLINVFLLNFLPFLAVMIVLITLLNFPVDLSGAYIALFFSLLLVHQTFRSYSRVHEMVYIEYYYCIGYLLLVFALFDLAIISIKHEYYKHLKRLLFINIFALLAFCATVFTFFYM